MNILFLDFETSKKPRHLPWIPGSFPVSLHLIKYTNSFSTKKTFIFNHTSLNVQPNMVLIANEIQNLINDSDCLVAHNFKFDAHWLTALGIKFENKRIYCTMVAQYHILGQNKKFEYSLDECCWYFDLPKKLDLVKQWWDAGFETDEIPISTLTEYGEQDVEILKMLFDSQQPIIKQQNMEKIINLRCESLRVTQDIERNGMFIDITTTNKFSQDYGERYVELERDAIGFIHNTLGIPVDVLVKFTSNDHLSAILFGGIIKYKARETILVNSSETVESEINGKVKRKKVAIMKERERTVEKEFKTKGLGFVPAAKTETKKKGYFQTDVVQMSKLKPKTEEQRRFLSSIFEMGKIEKMKGTYFDNFLKNNIDGYLHTNINEAVTVTGRYSSSLQQIPRGSTSPVKECFVTRYGEE